MPKESGLQKKCKQLANSKGAKFVKLHSESSRGWPDCELIIPPNGLTIRIEFKHPDKTGRVSTIQKHTIIELESLGCLVYVCDSYDYFVEILEHHLENKPGKYIRP